MQSQVESPLRFVSFLEKLTDLKVGPAAMARLFSIEWYNNELNEGGGGFRMATGVTLNLWNFLDL
ncbi:putative phosphoenolpyruvate carboxylase [Helianthus annuus]|nr:putative phosphoenolpyruvate carboxylase [Helianthus annuus]